MAVDKMHEITTKLLLAAASVTGITGEAINRAALLDIYIGIVLKLVSIISFIIVIVINWPKLMERLKKRKKKGVKL